MVRPEGVQLERILITAGPTREHLDDVRFLANGSSGRMGYALAGAAARAGSEVVLVSGPVALEAPQGVRRVDVVSACEMLEAAEAEFDACSVAFFVAAVCDYRPAQRRPGKPPKVTGPQSLALVPNPDIAATLGARRAADQISVGFALEHDHRDRDAPLSAEARSRAMAKMERKRFSMIALNRTSAMDARASRVSLLRADGAQWDLPSQPKERSAQDILAAAGALRAGADDPHPWRQPGDDQEG